MESAPPSDLCAAVNGSGGSARRRCGGCWSSAQASKKGPQNEGPMSNLSYLVENFEKVHHQKVPAAQACGVPDVPVIPFWGGREKKSRPRRVISVPAAATTAAVSSAQLSATTRRRSPALICAFMSASVGRIPVLSLCAGTSTATRWRGPLLGGAGGPVLAARSRQ